MTHLRNPWLIAPILIAAGLVLTWPVRGAERIDGAWEINIYAPASRYSESGPSIVPLKDGRHESREACRQAIMFVKVRESGVKLRCDPVEGWRVR